jgi:hypothetical protein
MLGVTQQSLQERLQLARNHALDTCKTGASRCPLVEVQ